MKPTKFYAKEALAQIKADALEDGGDWTEEIVGLVEQIQMLQAKLEKSHVQQSGRKNARSSNHRPSSSI